MNEGLHGGGGVHFNDYHRFKKRYSCGDGFYIPIHAVWILVAFLFTIEGCEERMCKCPIFWSGIMVAATLAVIATHTL